LSPLASYYSLLPPKPLKWHIKKYDSTQKTYAGSQNAPKAYDSNLVKLLPFHCHSPCLNKSNNYRELSSQSSREIFFWIALG